MALSRRVMIKFAMLVSALMICTWTIHPKKSSNNDGNFRGEMAVTRRHKSDLDESVRYIGRSLKGPRGRCSNVEVHSTVNRNGPTMTANGQEQKSYGPKTKKFRETVIIILIAMTASKIWFRCRRSSF